MPDLPEFVGFVARKSGVNKPLLIEQDILIHRLLKTLSESNIFKGKYLFKGGSCLVKCYYGYYRFSVDLDFSWKDQAYFKAGKSELQRRLKAETESFGSILQDAAQELQLEFKNDSANRRYIEFGGGKRMATYKLWRENEYVKVQVNYVEELLFKAKKVRAATLLDGVELQKDELAYFSDFLDHYTQFFLEAYDEREILCEKMRAIMTRKAQKLRDFYDLFILDVHGFEVGQFSEEILRKTRAARYYRKYRDNLEANKATMAVNRDVFESPYERSLFIKNPSETFDRFVNELHSELRKLVIKV